MTFDKVMKSPPCAPAAPRCRPGSSCSKGSEVCDDASAHLLISAPCGVLTFGDGEDARASTHSTDVRRL